MSLSLSVVDNHDDSGATATVAGTASGLVTIYTQLNTGEANVNGWELTATITGDGTVQLVLAVGNYFAYAIEGTTLSPVFYFGVTSGAFAPQTQCRAGIKARLLLMNFVGLPGKLSSINGRIYEQYRPDYTKVSLYPCVLLTIDGVLDSKKDATSNRDFVWYPCRLEIHGHSNPIAQELLPYYERWRYQITQAFECNAPLAGVDTSILSRVEPYQIADERLPEYQKVVSAMIIKTYCSVPRGLAVL